MDGGGTGILALLCDDGFCVRLRVSPAGRRSLLAEMASKSLMDNRGLFGTESTNRREGWRDLIEEREAVTRETWPERDVLPVRDTDAGSCHGQPRRPVVPSVKVPVASSSSNALGCNSFGSSIRDAPVPFISNYHIGHCQSHPNSSSFPATEFPRQTSKPSIVTGNFVVGEGTNPRSSHGECSLKRSNYSRSSDEYGSFYYRTSPSISPTRYTDEEAFVSSLRRYPRSAPDRSKSIDLLQSIAYLQQNVNNKNLQVKTLRYLREKAREVETELRKLQEKLSKRRMSEEPTRETYSPSDYAPKYRDTKSSFLRENIFKRQSKFSKAQIKRSQSYENYDYLKITSPDGPKSPPNKGVDVRYLTDISSELKRFIDAREDTVQMSICPKLSKRYFDHCRLHHRKTTEQQTWYDCKEPYQSGSVCEDADSPCGFRSDRSQRPPKICCHCRRPIPCGCHKQMTREEFIIQKINEWFQEIPIYPNETFLEKSLRADLMKKLKSRLVRLPEKPDFVEHSKKYIEECVEKLPMWRPESKAEQDVLQRQIVNNLLEKLEGVTSFAIDKEIIEAFDIVKFKLRDSNSVLVNRNNLMKDVTEQLRDVIKNGMTDDRAFREQLRSKVADILAELPIETRIGKKRETLERLADEITDKLMKIQTKGKEQRTAKEERAGTSRTQEEFEQKALNLLKSIPGVQKIPETERNRIQQEIIRKLQEIRRHSDTAEVEGVVKDIVSNVVKKTGVPLDDKKLAQRLTGQITTAANTGTEEKMLWKIVENMSDLETVNRPELNKAVKEFAQKIRNIKRSSGEHVESTVQEETIKFLETLSKKADKTIKPAAINKMKEKIGKQMTEHVEEYFHSPHGSLDSGKVRMISNWLEEIEQFLEVDKEVRDKMATALSRKLNEIQKQGHDAQEIMPEEILRELQGMAKTTGVELHSDEEDEIAGDLMEKITKVMIETANQENAIWEAIDAIPVLQDVDQNEHYRAVKDLAMKLQDMKLHGGTRADVHKETKVFVEDVAKKTGLKREDIKTDLASKLTKKFNITPEKKIESERKKWANITQQSKGNIDLKKVIHDEVRDVLDETSITMNPSIKRDLESLLADQKMRGKTGLEAAEEISRFLQNSSNLTMEEAEIIAEKLTTNLDNKLGTSMQESPQDRLVDEALNFFDQLTDANSDTAAMRAKKQKLAEDLALKVQAIIANPTLSKKEKEDNIRDETVKVLRKIDLKTKVPLSQLATRLAKKLDTVSNRSSTPIPGDRNVGLNASVSSSDIALSPITSDTLFVPKRGKTPRPSKKSMEQLEQVIRDWFARNNANIFEDKVKKLASEFVDWSRSLDENTEYDTLDEEGSLRNHLKQWLERNTELSKRENFPSLVNSLLERLRSIALPSTSRQKRSGKSSVPESTAELSDWIARWCDKLPLVPGSSPQDQAEINALKQNLISKIMLKITALNMNPETLKNDFLYESMLSDEIEQLLDEFPQSRELATNRAELKKELIDVVKAAKQNIKEELAGNTYRQQIKDVIKKILPSIGGYEIIQEKFDGLRSNIADAFISVVTATSCQQNAQATATFYEEVDKCIAEYTKLCAGHPNACELKRNLFCELQSIPVPSAAALRSQLGEIQVRDMVRSWIAQLPLKPNLTSEQEVHLNKIISVLALRLREIEKESQSSLDLTFEKKLQSEITKWLSKLPLKWDVNFEELSARFAESFKNRTRPDLNNIPPSALSAEDREHMERIRGRSSDENEWITSRLCPSASGRPCMATVTEISCQTSASQHKPCRSFSRLAPASSRCCQNSTQTISCKASQTCVTPPCSVSRNDAHLQTSCEMRDQSQCVRSPGSYKQTCHAPRRYHVSNPCNSSSIPPNPCSASYDTSCNPQPSCSYGPPCVQGLGPQMKPPSCLIRRAMKDRPRSSVQIAEPADRNLDPPKYYKESGTTVEIGPRGNLGRGFVQKSERRQQGNWYDCQRPTELSQNTCADQRGPMRCKKRKDWRRRSILSSKGPCKSCAEPVKCNRFCTMNCPYPSFLYFRN